MIMESNLITKANLFKQNGNIALNPFQRHFKTKVLTKFPRTLTCLIPLALPFTTLFTRPIKIHLQDSFLGTISHLHAYFRIFMRTQGNRTRRREWFEPETREKTTPYG